MATGPQWSEGPGRGLGFLKFLLQEFGSPVALPLMALHKHNSTMLRRFQNSYQKPILLRRPLNEERNFGTTCILPGLSMRVLRISVAVQG